MSAREEVVAKVANDCMSCLWGIQGALNLIESDEAFQSTDFPDDIGNAIRLIARSVRATVAENGERL